MVRDAADGPVRFGKSGPEGNETAVHTEQVYAFFAEHYDHWAAALNVDRGAWADCHWGENLMLRGSLREENLHVGDRFRIGEALLEVTSPRIPCFKLSWRLGQPEQFLGQLIASGLMGVYFRVIEPGSIGPGDAIVREHEAAEAITVLALSKLLHDPTITDVDVLGRVLSTPGLGGQASGMIRKRINALTDGLLMARGRWQGWRRFMVDDVRVEAEGIKSFRLRPADGGPIGGYRAGQFLTVRLPDEAGGHVRTWSLSDYDQQAGHYRLSVKQAPGGRASAWLHEKLPVGAEVEVRPPAGRFVLDRGGFLRTVMISAGIGVTPMLAMLKAHAERGAEAPPLLWIHCTHSGRTHAFREEVDALLDKLPGAVRRIFYSRPEPDDVLGVDYDFAGRVTAEAVAAMLQESYRLAPFGRALELTGDNADFYLCGPPAFEQVVRDALGAGGVNPALIRSESFNPAGAAGAALDTPERSDISFVGSNRATVWLKDDDATLLEVAEACGIDVESGCRMGLCGTCEVGLRSGEVGYVTPPAALPERGRVLLCCAQPLSAKVEIEA
ncbi:MOSC domain-containing protein [Sphingosinicella rhizophila]|uniref:MOSC domain-containing protein n=1 Tax=Sphingosinicella rhizophila TaxID=3050082 RepID=A0ABU3QAD0_9SPHN|nr:MOSC domain-containing protein [Sphingosinicella sp. GR2756]MDT9600079.1 MOSC domain-containing protein [Sphingosinicella sp. GR2756]